MEDQSRREWLRNIATTTLLLGAPGIAVADEHTESKGSDSPFGGDSPIDPPADDPLDEPPVDEPPVDDQPIYSLEFPQEYYNGTEAVLKAKAALPPEEQKNRDSAILFQVSMEATAGPTTRHHRTAISGVPETIRFGPDEVEKEFRISWTDDVTTEVKITIDAVEGGPESIQKYRDALLRILGPPPVLKDVTTVKQANAMCSVDGPGNGYTFDITADHFYPRQWNRTWDLPMDEVVIEHASSGRREVFKHQGFNKGAPNVYPPLKIMDVELGDDIPWKDMRIRCTTPSHANPGALDHWGTYDVRTEAYTDSSRQSNTLESALHLNNPVPSPQILSFDVTPSEVPGINNSQEVTLEWDVRYANRVEITNLRGGRLGRDPGEFNETWEVPDFRECEVRGGSTTDKISTTETYEMRAYAAWSGEDVDEVAVDAFTVTSERDDAPEPEPLGFDQIFIFNCDSPSSAGSGSSDVPTNRYIIMVQEGGSGSWRKLTSKRGNEYLDPESGPCLNTYENDYIHFDLEDGTTYNLLVLKPDLYGCGKTDPSPTDANCWAVDPFTLQGKSSGLITRWGLPGPLL